MVNNSNNRMLIGPLKKILENLQCMLDIDSDAVEFLETLCLRLVMKLCENPLPHRVEDVENRVLAVFPTPIEKWAIKDAKETLERGKKRSIFPVDKIQHFLNKELISFKIDSCVTLFLTAIVEYVAKDILMLTANYVKNIHHFEITLQDVKVAMCTDKVLMDLFYQEEDDCNNIFMDDNDDNVFEVELNVGTIYKYERVVKEFIGDEKQYLRDLQIITKVFQEELYKISVEDFEVVFTNIAEICELTVTIISNLEDIVEMSQGKDPLIGTWLFELAEALEFDVYLHYAKEVDKQKSHLEQLLERPHIQTHLQGAGQGFVQALHFYLPKLLNEPLNHCYIYFDYLKSLMKFTQVASEKECLKQVQGLLKPLEMAINSLFPIQNKVLTMQACRRLTLEKLRDLQTTVENWELREVGQYCNEFVKEDTLSKWSANKKLTERRAILFDGILILCKHHHHHQPSSLILHHNHYSYREYRLKEKFHVRKIEIRNLDDTDDYVNAFEIIPRNEPRLVLVAKTADMKSDWLSNLVMLNTKPMFDRILDSILMEMKQNNPLKLPPLHLYRFAEPDSKANIVFEHRESLVDPNTSGSVVTSVTIGASASGPHPNAAAAAAAAAVPIIKGATLVKLVERLTFHLYADMSFMRTFLTTYRSFCDPDELLNLLIERFNIPEPNIVYGCENNNEANDTSCSIPEEWKRYRKEYCQPIKLRVLNVIKHWIEYHFYDFQNNPNLLERLKTFLKSTSEKKMKTWADTSLKLILRKTDNEAGTMKERKFIFDQMEPAIEWHMKNLSDEDFGILTLHPLEFARQLTLLEFCLYKLVRPSELVGSVWTKKDKEVTSPNLLKIIKHTTNLTRWLEKNIVEANNFEERVALVSRIIEIMMCLQDLNNFNGILAIISALGSASVFRLKHTFQALPRNLEKALEECRELNCDHFRKYQEKLRTINPPCVPFLGMCLTNILHIEEGNPNLLMGTSLINFAKRRKVAEITDEIQQFQNQEYCLKVEPRIRSFLANLNPFGDMRDTDISNYLYDRSLDIEPRGSKQPLKFPRKWPDMSLKSPGVKPKSSKSCSGTGTSMATSATSSASSSSTTPVRSDNEENSPSALADTFMNNSQTPSPTHISSPSSISVSALSSIQNWFSGHSRSNSIISLTSSTPSSKAAVVATNPTTLPLTSPKSLATSSTNNAPLSDSQTPETHLCQHEQAVAESPLPPPPPLPPRLPRRDLIKNEMPPILPPKDDRLPPPLPPRSIDSKFPRLNSTTAHSTLLLRRSLAASAPLSPVLPSMLSPSAISVSSVSSLATSSPSPSTTLSRVSGDSSISPPLIATLCGPVPKLPPKPKPANHVFQFSKFSP